jgi:hypothetical protein
MNDDKRIVAVGLLTNSDLERLGAGFDRAFPVQEGDDFADLLHQLELVDWDSGAPARSKGRE